MIRPFMVEQSFKIVWFPKNLHTEISIGEKIHYFIGRKDFYGHKRNLSYSLSNTQRTPVVLFEIKSDMDEKAIYGVIEKQPPSLLNTCMGSAADIARKVTFLEIPVLVRQSPELSAIYLMMRHYVVADVSFDTYQISKTDAVYRACKIGAAQLAILAFSCYFLCISVVHLVFTERP